MKVHGHQSQPALRSMKITTNKRNMTLKLVWKRKII